MLECNILKMLTQSFESCINKTDFQINKKPSSTNETKDTFLSMRMNKITSMI